MVTSDKTRLFVLLSMVDEIMDRRAGDLGLPDRIENEYNQAKDALLHELAMDAGATKLRMLAED
jgi:hypothetical protein